MKEVKEETGIPQRHVQNEKEREREREREKEREGVSLLHHSFNCLF